MYLLYLKSCDSVFFQGTFRSSCELVLRAARRGRETLLTLLEAFVYDPLVEWKPGAEGVYNHTLYASAPASRTQDKQSLERQLAWDMLAIRAAEIGTGWTRNR